MTQTKIADRFQAQVKMKDGKWFGVGRPMHETIDEARTAINDYGKPVTIGDLGNGVCVLAFPADKTKHTFRIVKCERTVIEEFTKGQP